MKNILDEIVTNKKEEIQLRKQRLSLEELKNKVQTKSKKSNLFKSNLTNKSNDISLIAEIKIKSPSAGTLSKNNDIYSKVKEYQEAGADAISVITDTKYFDGSLELLASIKSKTELPILQKDFVIDEYQIYEAALYGADALLLIARIISDKQLQMFVDVCFQLSIEPLVEVYDTDDLNKALKTRTSLMGVNARDLDTFTVNIENACNIGRQIPKDKIFIGLSGVNDRKDVEHYKNSGAQAVLVGTALMKSNDIKKIIKILKKI